MPVPESNFFHILSFLSKCFKFLLICCIRNTDIYVEQSKLLYSNGQTDADVDSWKSDTYIMVLTFGRVILAEIET